MRIIRCSENDGLKNECKIVRQVDLQGHNPKLYAPEVCKMIIGQRQSTRMMECVQNY